MSSQNGSVAATFCATLVDEWARAGVRDAVVSPGSRSTPMTLALDADGRIRVHVHPDERSAAFMALGLAVVTSQPTVVVTTSGTAAVEVHPAVVEAHHSDVPLVVCTADRPPELHGVGAPQTIDQGDLFGGAVRACFDPGPPTEHTASSWRSLASRVLLAATGPPSGPVHLNLAFREPLVGDPAVLPAGRDGGVSWHRSIDPSTRIDPARLESVVDLCRDRRGVIVAGDGIVDPDAVVGLGRLLGWPVLADPRSGCRVGGDGIVGHFDPILRVPGVPSPQVALCLGRPPASKVLGHWLSGATRIAVETHGRWFDVDRTVELMVGVEPSALCASLAEVVGSIDPIAPDGNDPQWIRMWIELERVASEALAEALDSSSVVTEPGAARALAAAMPADGALVVSSSMPIRDLEWFSGPFPGARVIANRGANGIDGVVSTAVGVALSGRPTALLIGDLAFVHDSNGLIGLTGRGVDLTVVVVDNNGGGIFSMLPQAQELPSDRFERLFATPHGVDIVALGAAHGITSTVSTTGTGMVDAIRGSLERGGVGLVVVRSTRDDNVRVHAELDSAVARRVERVFEDVSSLRGPRG